MPRYTLTLTDDGKTNLKELGKRGFGNKSAVIHRSLKMLNTLTKDPKTTIVLKHPDKEDVNVLIL